MERDAGEAGFGCTGREQAGSVGAREGSERGTGRWYQAVASEGDWPRAARFDPVAALPVAFGNWFGWGPLDAPHLTISQWVEAFEFIENNLK